ncbi:MAG: nitrous oxide reductase family maturation protein NosD [Bacteroidetes bacterium]|nr:nitrous oxide reductase family maturation protein NosD [Bacteroidota bacterium]
MAPSNMSIPKKITLSTTLAVVIFLFACSVSATTITVSKNGPVKTISAALLLANPSDTLLVTSGEYAEGNILVNKKITIIGDNFPVIDGKEEGEIFTVTADDVHFSGLQIQGSGLSFLEENAGIKLKEVKNCSITNCKFLNNFFAVYLAKAADCTIENNFIKGESVREVTSGNGIHLWYCRDITIINNQILNHRDGIYFEFVRNGKIQNNYSKGNLRYGLHFMYSDSCEYANNTFEQNGAGVAVMYTKNVLMKENHFINNWGTTSYGILLKDISDSKIERNIIDQNSVGLYMEGCGRVTISNNTFSKNGWALKLMANSMDNYFYDNNFIANAFDVSTNSRQNFNTFSKNYWAAYKGYDLNNDGYGDVPFRPVTMFSMIIESQPTALILLHSLFIDMMNIAESIIPAITPKALTDSQPRMRPAL